MGDKAFSAGSHPKGAVHPLALKELQAPRIPTDGFRSKGWDEFAAPGAPAFGRMFSDSFAGIAPASVPGFVVAELVGAALAVWVHALLGGTPVADGSKEGIAD